MKIKAVLFDCDGLMFETELISQQMWRDAAAEYGETVPQDFFVKITGTHDRLYDPQKIREQMPHFDEIMAKMRRARFDMDFWNSIHTDCINKPGLLQLFPWLKANGYKTAICSSSFRNYVETLAKNVSVPLEYDEIVTGDMVEHSKPAPDIFLKGAQLLGVEPQECLVLEDSKNGIMSAVNAGMHSCFIEDTIEPDDEMRAIIEFEEKTLADVIDLLERINEEASV